jgi:RNA polymerase sigma-70 factor, ECF subfamily
MDHASTARVECAQSTGDTLPPRSSVVHVRRNSKPKPTFAEVYRDGFDFVWRNLYRLGVPSDVVRDAAQDVFLVVHRKMENFDGTAAVKTWLFGITMRVASQYRRNARRAAFRAPPTDALDSKQGDALERTVSPSRGPLEELEAKQANELLLALLDELDDERRAVFVLTELEQMSAPEIADALEINVNTVYGRLRTARQQFSQALTRFQARKPVARGRLP